MVTFFVRVLLVVVWWLVGDWLVVGWRLVGGWLMVGWLGGCVFGGGGRG